MHADIIVIHCALYPIGLSRQLKTLADSACKHDGHIELRLFNKLIFDKLIPDSCYNYFNLDL